MKTANNMIAENNNIVAETNYTSFSINHYFKWYTNKKLNMDPPYQRNVVWQINKKRAFIESIMMGCPIPSLMFSLDKDNKYTVLDGKQRLTTIVEFVSNKFSIEIGDKDVYFATLDDKVKIPFMNKHLPASLTEGLTLDNEATIFERINRAEKLSDGERTDSYYKSPLAIDRNNLFIKGNEFYDELCQYWGQYNVKQDKRKGHLANKTTTVLVLAKGTVTKGTFDTLQPFLELNEKQWRPYRYEFVKRAEKLVELWRTIVQTEKIVIPEKWKKPDQIWKHSFLTSYIVHSMIEDENNYIANWVKFIRSLSEKPSLYNEWPHTKITKDNASDTAKSHFKSQWQHGYHQVVFYNKNGYFDKKDLVVNVPDDDDLSDC